MLGRALPGVLVLCLGSGVLPMASASAGSINDLQRRAAQIADQIDRVGEQFSRLAEAYDQAVLDAAQADSDVTVGKSKVSALEGQFSQLQNNLRDFAIKTFASGGQAGGIGELLGGSSKINETVVKEQFATMALASGQDVSFELEGKLGDLRTAQAALQRQQQRKAKAVTGIKAAQAAAQAKQAELVSLQKQNNAALRQAIVIEQNRRAKAAAAAARAALEAAKQKAKDRGTKPRGGGGATTVPGGGGGGGRGGGSDSPPATDDTGGGSGGGGSGGGGSGGGTPHRVPPISPRARSAVAAARSQIGVPYRFGAALPEVAFDCSGLTAWAWGRAGVNLPHQSARQYAVLPHVDVQDIAPGDLVFFHSPISHVGIYIGDGMMIEALRTGAYVQISAVRWNQLVGIARPH